MGVGGGKGSCGVTVRPVSPRLRKKREGRDAERGEQGRRRRRKGKGREEEEKELAAVGGLNHHTGAAGSFPRLLYRDSTTYHVRAHSFLFSGGGCMPHIVE